MYKLALPLWQYDVTPNKHQTNHIYLFGRKKRKEGIFSGATFLLFLFCLFFLCVSVIFVATSWVVRERKLWLVSRPTETLASRCAPSSVPSPQKKEKEKKKKKGKANTKKKKTNPFFKKKTRKQQKQQNQKNQSKKKKKKTGPPRETAQKHFFERNVTRNATRNSAAIQVKKSDFGLKE